MELLGATEDDSVTDKYFAKHGVGMHHIAIEVDDIYVEIKRLKKEGFTLLSEEPSEGVDNKLVTFVHPKDNSGVLVVIPLNKFSANYLH